LKTPPKSAWSTICRSCSTFRRLTYALGDGTTKRSVTHGSQRAATVLRALGIAQLDPPQQGETVMS
jgi:hypothetical protein